MLYFLCGFFGDGVRRRVFGNSGWRHAGGIKGLVVRSTGLSPGTACLSLGESGYPTELPLTPYEIAGR